MGKSAMRRRTKRPRQAPTTRIGRDIFFFATLGSIGGAYVVLIVLMLLADATYLFTSSLEVPVQVGFTIDPDGKRMLPNDVVHQQYERYGLTITSGTDSVPMVFDSSNPPFPFLELGTPNRADGGPGLGAATTNKRHLGNVVVLTSPEKPDLSDAAYQSAIDFPQPVTVTGMTLPNVSPDQAVELVWIKADGETEVQQTEARALATAGRMTDVLTVVLRSSVRLRDVLVDFEFQGSFDSQARQTAAQRPEFREVTRDAAAIRLLPGQGSLSLAWEDPVRLRDVTLLNVTGAATVKLWDSDDECVLEQEIEPEAINDVMRLRFDRPGVARMDLSLPPGAALADTRFTWLGRVRSQWERDNPTLARFAYNPITIALQKEEIRYSIQLSLISCTISAIISIWVAIPIGYLLSRYRFFGDRIVDAVLDIPIVLPPLVVGLSLLILFNFLPERFSSYVVYQIPAVILAQFSVACAFAVRTMRATFDQLDDRREQVAWTLGCSRFQAFTLVVLPEAKRGIVTAITLAWARSLGEFGPLLVFAGTTRNKTEVLSTSVFLELSIGDLSAAVAVSMIMVFAAVVVLIVARLSGNRVISV